MSGTDVDTFRQIFRDHWETFKARYPRFDTPDFLRNWFYQCPDLLSEFMRRGYYACLQDIFRTTTTARRP